MVAASLLRHPRRAGSSVGDWTLALVMLAVTLVGSVGEALAPVNSFGQTVTSGGHPAVVNASWAAFILVGVAAVALGWRRQHPRTVLAASLTTVAAYSLLGYVNGTALLDVAIAVYTVATLVPAREAIAAATLAAALLMVATALHNPFGALGGGEFLIPGEVAAAASLGLAMGNRRAYLRAVEERAEQAERTREEEAARRVDAERLRIARDLHDAVAHTLSMINVQAGAAAHVAADRPAEAAVALEAIRVASKEGLREMRSILNVLRRADEEPAPTQPAPGLGMLESLVSTACGAGLLTTVTVVGSAQRLPATLDLAAYRIIQEALTNAVRHAGPATATVELSWSADRLRIDIRDTGRGANGTAAGASPDDTGYGLTGMRERVAAVGGSLTAGPVRGGGFAVTAELPTVLPT